MTDTPVPPVQNTTDHHDHEHADLTSAPDKLVPVGEAIRYRKRAQTAEQQLDELNEEIRKLQTKLSEADQTVTHLERRQKVDELLTESDAIDLEAARILTESAVAMMDDPDIELAIQDLRRHKPYLFRRRHTSGVSAMAPSLGQDSPDPAEQAADQAMRSGDRRDLLRYLRLRRRA